MSSKIASIICSSLLIVLVSGCRTTTIKIGSDKWPLPEKPKLESVEITSKDEGFFMDKANAENLADNIDELKAYIEKLEALIEKIGEHYK